MKIKKTGTIYEIALEGPIGEASPLFNLDVRNATEIQIDGEKMTYINSIGVKNWILWTVRIPPAAKVSLRNLPLVLINQASQVQGFLPQQARIDSFNAPFVCPGCNAEAIAPLSRGLHFDYAQPGASSQVKLPKIICNKCKQELEPDFLESKTFAFLNTSG